MNLFKKDKELKTDINNFSFKNCKMKMQTIKADVLKYISVFAAVVSTLFLIFIVLTPFSLLYAMTKIVMDFIQRVFHK